MAADLRADGDGWEDIGRDADLVIGEGAEWGDVMGGVVVEVFDPRDNAKGLRWMYSS